MKALFSRSAWRTIIFLILAVTLSLIGIILGIKELSQLQNLRQQNPFVFGGSAYEQLRPMLRSEEIIGYITDRDQKNDKNAALFIQIQLSMAPIILDLNKPNHRILIIDCENRANAKMILERYHARPLRESNTGIIIAERSAP